MKKEGYYTIDHRSFNGKLQEMGTYTCSHCNKIVVLNPERIRNRAYCPKCDHNICDTCEDERVRTGLCNPFKKQADEYYDLASKGLIING